MRLGYLASAVGAALWGTGPVIAKNLQIGGVAMNAYRWLMIGACVFALDAARGRPLTTHAMRITIVPGAVIGLNVSLFFSAARETSVVNATIINSLHPIVVAVIATRFLGERIRMRAALWGALALAATIVVILGEPADGVNSAWGDLLAAGSAVSFAFVFIASQRARQQLPTTTYLTATALWAAAVSAVLALLIGQDLSWPVGSDWGGLLLLVAVPGLLGTALVFWSVGTIPVWISSSLALLVPVFAAVTAWIALGESMTVAQMVAMLVAVGALIGLVHASDAPAATASSAHVT
ncbi:MAG: DMT family transporter [Actinomycetota bacterium]